MNHPPTLPELIASLTSHVNCKKWSSECEGDETPAKNPLGHGNGFLAAKVFLFANSRSEHQALAVLDSWFLLPFLRLT